MKSSHGCFRIVNDGASIASRPFSSRLPVDESPPKSNLVTNEASVDSRSNGAPSSLASAVDRRHPRRSLLCLSRILIALIDREENKVLVPPSNPFPSRLARSHRLLSPSNGEPSSSAFFLLPGARDATRCGALSRVECTPFATTFLRNVGERLAWQIGESVELLSLPTDPPRRALVYRLAGLTLKEPGNPVTAELFIYTSVRICERFITSTYPFAIAESTSYTQGDLNIIRESFLRQGRPLPAPPLSPLLRAARDRQVLITSRPYLRVNRSRERRFIAARD